MLGNSQFTIHNSIVAISPARQTAFRILLRVESGRRFAADLLQTPEVDALSEADRKLATELVMGTLRWWGELDYRLEQLSGKRREYFDPEVLAALRMGLYQILFLARIPKSAAVDESVELVKRARKRSAAGLVNAVLRKCAPAGMTRRAEVGSQPSPEELASARRTLPDWLAQSWERQYGRAATDALAWASTHVPPVALRAVRAQRQDLARRLREAGIETRPGRYAAQALVVESGSAHASRALREGEVVIQDEASQLVAELVAARPGQRVLDLCAAPGIKTAQLAATMGEGLLLAADLSARRLRNLQKLLPKPLSPGLRLQLVRLDASCALPFACTFDRILVDAPCSGTGTLARNPEIKHRLRPEDVERLAGVQSAILGQALAFVAPGGRLVYSTCSLEGQENEAVVEKALADNPEFHLLPDAERRREFPALAPLFNTQGYFHTRPDLHGTDGFFAAVLVRKS